MSPVHAIRVFVHPIYAWKQIHAWMQICSEWNEATLDGSQCLDLMYGQALGRSYVIPPGMQRFGKQRWRQASECRHVQERILIVCCICSWHARDLRISTQITVSRPESHGSCSQMKAYCSDRIWERRKDQHHRRWEDQCWLNTPCIWARFIANIEQRSLSSERIYWCNRHIIAELQHLCSRAHLLARFRRLVQSEYRFLRYFTDAWNIHQQDDFIFLNVYSLFHLWL